MAIVHEWLDSRAGSEKTFEQMAIAYEDADLYALTVNPGVEFQTGRAIVPTLLQRSSIMRRRRAASLLAMPLAWKLLRPPAYDIVITSSHAFARYFPVGDAVHLSYVYTPLRYAWLPEIDGRGSSKALEPARALLRQLDLRGTFTVHAFAAISTVVRERIEKFYDRSATTIFPPVDVEFFSSGSQIERGDFILGVSRWIDYKRLDLVISAAELLDVPVVIAGNGPQKSVLEAQAKEASVPVAVVESPSDEQLRLLYQQALAVVFPAEEDFGIVPVEAQAAGAPVVALRRGGSCDTVVDGATGILVDEQNAQSFAEGASKAIGMRMTGAQAHVSRFSKDTFRKNLRAWVSSQSS